MSAINATDASDVLSQYQLKSQDGGKGTSELGRNEFMELMLAQLKNQNPLEPQDNGEFISQLAQFSSLEEMQNLSGTHRSGFWAQTVKSAAPSKCRPRPAGFGFRFRARTVNWCARLIWVAVRLV